MEPTFGPDPAEIEKIEAARAASAAAARMGGEPAAIDALALARHSTIEGVVVYSNPLATYAAMQVMAAWAPELDIEAPELDFAGMVRLAYAFAAPVPAYQAARRGEEAYDAAAMTWCGERFPGPDAALRLGRVVGVCAGHLQLLAEVNPQ
jgi:hypothetical protein